MPTYHYRCSACQHEFDQIQRFGEDALTECPECQGLIKRVPQPVGIVFKGSGWYINDSRKSEKSDKPEKAASGEKKQSDDSKSEKTTSSDKSEKKSEKKDSKPAAVGSDG